MIVELQQAFKDIVYDDKNHSYLNLKTGKSLIPSTSYKKKFQNGFDNFDYWLNKKAKEANITPEQMQEEWNEAKYIGVGRGSSIHNYAEALSWRKKINVDLIYPGIAKLKRQVDNYFLQDTYCNICTEFVVGNNIVGGTLDRLVKCTTKGTGVVDWKTDKEFKGSYGKFLKEPYQDYPDDTLSGYMLQINIYRQVLEDAGFPIDFMEIVHFGINNDDFVVYEIPKVEIAFN